MNTPIGVLPGDVATALLFSKDANVCSMLIEAFRTVAISSDTCDEDADFLVLLSCRRYEVVCIDFSMGDHVGDAVSAIRSGRSNRTAITMALTDGNKQSNLALSCGVHFVIQQPLSRPIIDGIIRAAYGLIVRERRRYFRCPLHVQVIAHRRTEGAWVGRASNISEGGMCIEAPVRLKPGEVLEIQFRLPSTSIEASTEAEVQWSDGKGRVGLQFVRMRHACQSDLQHWLMNQLDQVLEPALASLRQKEGFVTKLCRMP